MKIKLIGMICASLLILVFSCQNDQIEFNRYFSAGSTVYQSHCQNCHGAKGEGLNGLIPPLTDSAYLKTNRHQLPCFLKNGLKGKITLAAGTFEGEMPASELAPLEVAQVLTYVTNSFGNKMKTITVEEVAASACK